MAYTQGSGSSKVICYFVRYHHDIITLTTTIASESCQGVKESEEKDISFKFSIISSKIHKTQLSFTFSINHDKITICRLFYCSQCS
jgi:hypothetical protein